MFWFFEECGILVPQPGIEPAPLALEGEVFNHWTAKEVPSFVIFKTYNTLSFSSNFYSCCLFLFKLVLLKLFQFYPGSVLIFVVSLFL